MLTMQNDQPRTNDSSQQENNTLSATVQPVPTQEMQTTQTVAETANFWTERGFAAQSTLPLLLISLALLMVIVAIWLLRKRKQTDDTTSEIASVPQDAKPVWHKGREPLMYKNAPVDQSHNGLPDAQSTDADDEDTSKPLPSHDPDFENEATFIYQPKAELQRLGRLMRVTSEPRFPAELFLLASSAALSDGRTIAIGRHSKHNIVVIGDKSVSRQHAEIVQRGDQLFVRDCASTAGTLLNWKRLQVDEEMPLQHMDILSFGEAVYEFQLEKEETDSLLPLILTSTNEDTELIEK